MSNPKTARSVCLIAVTLALAACHAVLSYLKEAGPELQRKLTETTTKLADSLNAFCQEHGAPIAVKHFASVWRIVFTEDHPYQDLLFAMMRSPSPPP